MTKGERPATYRTQITHKIFVWRRKPPNPVARVGVQMWSIDGVEGACVVRHPVHIKWEADEQLRRKRSVCIFVLFLIFYIHIQAAAIFHPGGAGIQAMWVAHPTSIVLGSCILHFLITSAQRNHLASSPFIMASLQRLSTEWLFFPRRRNRSYGNLLSSVNCDFSRKHVSYVKFRRENTNNTNNSNHRNR